MEKTVKKYFLRAVLLLFSVVIVCETFYIAVLRHQCNQIVAQQNSITQWYTSQCVQRDDSFAHCDLVQEHLTKEELRKALAWANLCVSLYGDGETSWRRRVFEQRGDVYFAMQDYPNAIKDYTSAIATDSENTHFPNILSHYPVYFKRGMSYRNAGLDKEAVDDFCHGITLVKKRNDNLRLRDALALENFLRYEDLIQYFERQQLSLGDGVLVQEP